MLDMNPFSSVQKEREESTGKEPCVRDDAVRFDLLYLSPDCPELFVPNCRDRKVINNIDRGEDNNIIFTQSDVFLFCSKCDDKTCMPLGS